MEWKENQKFLCSAIVPVYNEEQNIKPLTERITKTLESVPICKHEIIFASDPSTDHTENIILSLGANDPRIKLIRFSRRFGQPASTMGGLRHPRTMKILLRPLYQRGAGGLDDSRIPKTEHVIF